jgi:signal peptidase I
VAPADVSARCGGSAQTYLVKRVVGLPGDHLESHGTTIYVNARALRETWGHSREFGVAIPSGTTVPPASYYVIGDNNFESCDSRYWGPVPRSMIVGRVFLRIWPPTRIGLL